MAFNDTKKHILYLQAMFLLVLKTKINLPEYLYIFSIDQNLIEFQDFIHGVQPERLSHLKIYVI